MAGRAEAPADAGEAERLLSLGSLYVDLPDRALMIGTHCVRAAFALPMEADGVALLIVLTRPGSNAAVGELRWKLGCPERVSGFTFFDVDVEEACSQVEAFLRLLVLYHSVADADRRGELPHMPAAQMRANPRRAAQRAKKHSLFRVQTLDAPREVADRPQAPQRNSGEGHRLDIRVAVRPHFRWQAHGPRWSLRKLILVDGHWRGPEDGRVRAPLVRLDAPHPRRQPQAGARQPTAARRDAHGIRNAAPDRRVARRPEPCPMEPIPVDENAADGEVHSTPGTCGGAERVAVEGPFAARESGARS